MPTPPLRALRWALLALAVSPTEAFWKKKSNALQVGEPVMLKEQIALLTSELRTLQSIVLSQGARLATMEEQLAKASVGTASAATTAPEVDATAGAAAAEAAKKAAADAAKKAKADVAAKAKVEVDAKAKAEADAKAKADVDAKAKTTAEADAKAAAAAEKQREKEEREAK
eukprot:7378152-Prymnesium_polylepis.1